MKGVRPLDNTEIEKVSNAFTGVFEVRNRGLFMLGVSVGGRISELLALTIGDVYQNSAPVTSLHFDKAIVKGGRSQGAFPSMPMAEPQLICWSNGIVKSIKAHGKAHRSSLLANSSASNYSQ